MKLPRLLSLCLVLATSLGAQPMVERLSRGVVAIHQPDGAVFVSWRLLADDPADVAFNVYRDTAAAAPEDVGPFASRRDPRAGMRQLNEEPLTAGTWFRDTSAALYRDTSYFVRPVIEGTEGEPSKAFTLPASAAPLPYVSIPLDTPEGYTPNDGSLGDLDGDGDYEIIIKQEQHPRDNSRAGVTGQTLLQAYRLDGTHLWTINLGKNIREGAHYTMFMVADLDGDGRAEVACKTADGTIDGVGQVIGDAAADWRGQAGIEVPSRDRSGARETSTGYVASMEGRIMAGPEYLTVFDGLTGAALATTRYIPGRHPDTDNPTPEQLKSVWGDGYANRSDRFVAGVAYLDGHLPSLLFCRGYYTRTVIAAWDFRGGELTSRWVFDSHDGNPDNLPFAGQGNHQLSVADVDNDGKQEVVYGAMVVDDDGTGLYSTGWGHGDALHVSDFDWSNPGLEVHDIQERFDNEGMSLRDARTGKPLFLLPSVKAAESGGDKGEGPGRGNAFNIDPRYAGAEMWAAGAGVDGLYAADGTIILAQRPRGFPVNFGIWWDGDLLRELLDGNRVLKWNWTTEQLDPLLVAHASTSNNGTKSTPTVSADLWGDWREEIIWRTRDNQELRIYTTTIPTNYRLVTLMQDPQYRMAIAWQNSAYNQPPHPSFALDETLPLPTRPVVTFPAAP
ncbi:rhamnogalacturonan lyase [Synoicihabitans lomoniglobus]|uniref:Rhamnogalacturonan lyase n=1 Tax=Synoicihabitans lomoniglobus TaxID=2909285 RepID=A0AAF0CHF6_9BACT|nr:rhamnogalacturonan lyase [Opitutaceae bacterium LMO-M01]WED64262.1 rhamnogalacturonan lyase [Opitutaceae bacterium LMO-M01]